ncbi:hypothetical protein G6F20_014238 [Rhizopus arrhizus]|nr:hypothetical protein G6F20_014238 [Rhizopus arrhizus]KAG1137321.1 hypothetical protein G6F36_016104 [Rhizopus arrhizus]
MVPFDLDSQDPGMPSFSADSVGSLMRRLPLRKAPGPAHLLSATSGHIPLLSGVKHRWSPSTKRVILPRQGTIVQSP